MDVFQATPRRRFTVEEVEQMLHTGLLREDEPVELIEGQLLVMTPQDHEHADVITALGRRLERACPDSHVRVQMPILVSEDSLPEPDLSLVSGSPEARFGARSHPRPPDTVLVVEVAVTTQAYDRRKARTYAAAGVPEYWLVDVPGRTLTRHREPAADGYGVADVVRPGDQLTVPGTTTVLDLGDVLPPPT